MLLQCYKYHVSPHVVGTHYCLAVGNDEGLELDETDEEEEMCDGDEE